MRVRRAVRPWWAPAQCLALSLRFSARPRAQFIYCAKNLHQALYARLGIAIATHSRRRIDCQSFARRWRADDSSPRPTETRDAPRLRDSARPPSRMSARRIGIAAHKLRRRSEGQIHQVVEDQDLSVAIGAGADADRRNRKLGGDLRGNFARNAFKHNALPRRPRPSACASARSRCMASAVARLHAVAAHAVHALRRQAQVADDGNLSFGQAHAPVRRARLRS